MSAAALKRIGLQLNMWAALPWAVFFGAVALRIWWRINPLEFNPINGDFQTFNAASHFLAGDVPFVEFTPYLGMGPTLLTASGLAAFGGSFAASVVASELICASAFVYVARCIFVWRDSAKPSEMAIGLYLVTALVAKVLFGSPFLSLKLLAGLLLIPLGLSSSSLIDPGHSLFVLRALWPFLLGSLALWALSEPTRLRLGFFGVVAGLGCLWSPDYGVVSAAILSGMLFCNPRVARVSGLVMIAWVIPAALYAAFVLTDGHPMAVVEFARGISEYQGWYFLDDRNKALSIGSLLENSVLFVNLMMILLCGIGAGWLVLHARDGKTSKQSVLAAVATTTVVVGVITSFKSAFVPYYLAPAATVMLCVGLSAIRWQPGARIGLFAWRVGLSAGLVGLLWSAALIDASPPLKDAERKLGVRLYSGMGDFGAFVNYVRERSNSPWSTYATGLEAALGVHHPIGPDYIIHALGHKARKQYLQAFERGHYPVVVTPRLPVVEWEAWSRRENFDFYRRLFTGYRPTANFSHWTVWEPRESEPSRPVACSVVRLSPDSVRLEVRGAKPFRLVDLSVMYSASKRPWFFLKGGISLLVTASDAELAAYGRRGVVVGSYGVPDGSSGWHLPAGTDADGRAQITLTGNPVGLVDLQILGCKGSEIAPVSYLGG